MNCSLSPSFVAALVAMLVIATGCETARNDSTGGKKSGAETAQTTEKDVLRRTEAHTHFAMGVVHEFAGRQQEALDEFFLAAKSDPDDDDLLLDVSMRLIDGKQYDRALELMEPNATREDASGVLMARLGFVYSQLGRTEKAIEINRAALKKLPQSFQATQNLYVNYIRDKQPEAALKVLDDAAALTNASPEFFISLAELYSNYELQFPAQRETIRIKQLAVLQRAAKSVSLLAPQLQMRLADGLSLLGDSDGARLAYLEVLKQQDAPTALQALARTKLADILLRSSDRAGAAEQLKALVRDDPSNATAYFFLGSFAMEQQQWTEAADYFQKVILFNPNFEQAYYDLARAQIAAGKPSDAVVTLQSARAKFSANFIVEFLLGTARSGQKDYSEALKHFTRAEIIAGATDEKRLTAGFYFQFAATLERSGDRAEAERYFEKCLALAPDDAEALNYLGYMWTEQGTNLERAKEMIERALKAEPDNEAFLDSMGWVLFKLNQPEPALEFILKAVNKAKEPDATLYDHLGDIYAALKQMDKAHEAWKKSLDVEANDTVKKKFEAAGPDTK